MATTSAAAHPEAPAAASVGLTITITHRRNLQQYLNDSETVPCPEFH